MLKNACDHLEELFGSVLLAVMATISFVNVVIRYITSYSFAFTEEIVLNLFVWVILLGISYGYRTRSHLVMSFVYDYAPTGVQKFFLHCSNALSIGFFLMLFYWSALQVIDEFQLQTRSDALEAPAWIYTMCMPLFSLLIIFRIAQTYWRPANETQESLC